MYDQRNFTQIDDSNSFAYLRSAGCSSCHRNLKSLKKQKLRKLQKTHDGLKLVPWETGQQLLWDVTAAHLSFFARFESGLVANPGPASAELKDLEYMKNRKKPPVRIAHSNLKTVVCEVPGAERPTAASFF